MQNITYLSVSPESLGIPESGLIRFLKTLKECRFPLHSLLLLRHGKLAYEAYCPPFGIDTRHRLYSVSKSITSVAVGRMITEGRLSLEDTVASFFPEYLPDNPSKYLMQTTVRDLLMMASPNECCAYDFSTPDFVKAFFDNPYPKHLPGAVFHYDTAGTVTLCALVEKIAGMPLLQYLRPVFDAIGIGEGVRCIKTPEGRSWTGSGIFLTPRELMRFAEFCMRLGEWNGTQWIDREYMRQATSRQIDNSVSESGYRMDGYGYQFWMLKEGGFSCYGMGSQLALVMPKYDTIFVCTGDTQAMLNAEDGIREALYRLLDCFEDGPLSNIPEYTEILRNEMMLTLPMPRGAEQSNEEMRIAEKVYCFEENTYGYRWMTLSRREDKIIWTYEKATGVHRIAFHMGAFGEEVFPEAYSGDTVCTRDKFYRCMTMAAWERENVLLGVIHSVDDYLGTIKIQFTFSGNSITVFMTKGAENFFDDYQGFITGRTD